ncbi:hypothetical protein GU243_08915 [Pseudarthrobacter psychrotolerans]|uniref:Uncharacterized protein n=1 Tax=Pseudarthrobacter psychrotolerans TaxID=2697569 RepID=A0A6P1NHM8_9MICC|nr:hypothetical protein [Pseudarthrobacter psychrotolerans]QHK19836.1 hypothetical protein GU243_08915 [Pseudarthrobacter psychrotolerans]
MPNLKSPTSAQVNEALRRIPTPPLRRAFFEGLKNPMWVEPLAKAGMFDNPPEPEATDDGLIRDFYWPEIDYLIRVAPSAPSAVVNVLLKLAHSRNAWVRRAVFTIGASIPANEAERLQPLLKSWSASGFGWRSDPREMVAFAVNLLKGGQYKSGKWMANLLFRPIGSKNSHKPDLALDDYWYQDGLPRIVEALGDDGLKTVLPWLEEYERHSGHLTEAFDLSDMSRESIRHKGDQHPSTEQSLIDAVRDLAAKAMAADPETAKTTLIKSRMALARKITLYAATEALRNDGDLNQGEVDGLLTVVPEFMADSEFRDDSCRIEFGELAREVARISPSSLEPLVNFISAGPRIEMDQLRERVRRDEDDTPEELQERIVAVLETWKHRWLSAIGSEALPPALKPVLTEFDARLGAIESPLSPANRLTSWSGPNSPVSGDEMSIMSSAELVAYLESWHDTGDGWGPEPSHEGQGRELSTLIATNPSAIDGIDDLVDRLRPTYLRAIMQGWEAAVKTGIGLDWHQAAKQIGGVLAHSDTSPFPVEGGDWDDDVDFRGAKKAAVSLLEELVKKRETPPISPDAAPLFADLLIRAADDETAWTEYDADDHGSGMDPLTLSINWQWPIRLHGLLNLMAHGTGTPWYGAARTAFEREIERPDKRGASRAVIGEGLGRLLSVDPDWLKPRLGALFGSADGISRDQQVALTTAMASHYYHRALYDLLTPSMIAAIQSTEPLVAGWHGQSDPLQRIGEWVVSALIFGHKTLSDSVAEAFFTTAEPKVRGEAVGRIAWSFIHAESVGDVVRDRLADLWDARVEHVRSRPEDKQELNEFYWFVRSGRFDASWWLPRLKESVELDPELAGQRFMIGKQIASSSDVDPRGALEATRVLLANREEAGMPVWDLTQNAVPMVIARAINSGDEQLKQDAIQFMDDLGENGNPGLEKEVNEVLSGRITQDDVGE